MDVLLSPNFLLGVFGALLTLYLSKQVAIPELRPIYETSDSDDELSTLRKLTSDNRQEIAGLEAQQATATQNFDVLRVRFDCLRDSLKLNQARLELLERRVIIRQVISRGLGFSLFVLFGGVVAYLLADQITVNGLSGAMPKAFQAIVIGAGWNGFLSVLGIRNIQEANSKQVDAIKDSTNQALNQLKTKLDQAIRPAVAQAPVMVPFSAQPAVSSKVSEEIDATIRTLNAQFDQAKSRLRDNARRVI